MPRLLLTSSVALIACTPSPQEAAMPSHRPVPATGAPASGKTSEGGQAAAARGPAGAAAPTDSPAAAEGRRTLSTAFVRIGPGGHLTVELRDGRVLVLRDVVMRRDDYCGVLLRDGGAAPARYCGAYAEVAAARPGGAAAPDEPEPATLDPRA